MPNGANRRIDEPATCLACLDCGREFPVQLRKMRLNFPVHCPFCTCPYHISEDQAIKAHRFLELMESRTSS